MKIDTIITQLSRDFAYSIHNPNARNGGLIGLAAAAIALGQHEVSNYLDDIVHPVLACFGDQDARVRYYACESMYNIAKVAKGEILPYFNELFDALCKLAADTDESVQKGADLLNRLIKDIVAEKAATYVSVVTEGPPEIIPAQVESSDPNQYVIANEPPQADKHAGFDSRHTAFSLPKFIPLLMERIYVINPAARTFLVSWIVLLDSIPDLELVSYLPAFLGGLINFLNDPTSGVRVATHAVLDNFLQEIRRITDIKRTVQENNERILMRKQIRRRNAEAAVAAAAAAEAALKAKAAADEAAAAAAAAAADADAASISATTIASSETAVAVAAAAASSPETLEAPKPEEAKETPADESAKEPTAEESEAPAMDKSATVDGSPLTIDLKTTHARNRSVSEHVASIDARVAPKKDESEPEPKEEPEPEVPAYNPASEAPSSVDSDEVAVEDEDEEEYDEDEENEGFYIPGQDVAIEFEKIIEILISHLDSSVEEIQIVVLRWVETFLDISPESILPYGPRFLSVLLPTMAYDGTDLRKAAEKVNQKLLALIMSLPDTLDLENGTSVDHEDSEKHLRFSKLDYPAMVNALTLHFLDEKEETRVAALDWLIMLHRKVPKRILAINDGTFPALLKTLSDPSDEVIKRDLRLIAQISYNSDDEYFSVFMVNLLNLFSTDRRLLETRGNLIIRQLCQSLKPERIYWTLAEILEKEEEDLEFASLMVQYLNNILLTAPELSQLRMRLRNLQNKEGVSFFTALFRSWCHNPSAALTLCLLAQAYEYAFMLLQTIVEFEITIPLLVQIDKLVQLLESPVFTHLRLQLLEPEKHPFLYKCLYGILMLLPQSSAFATLRNRLNSVSSIGYLHVPSTLTRSSGSTGSTGAGGASKPLSRLTSGANPIYDVKWPDLVKKFQQVQQKHQDARNRTAAVAGLAYGGSALNGPGSAAATAAADFGLSLSKLGGGGLGAGLSPGGSSVGTSSTATATSNLGSPLHMPIGMSEGYGENNKNKNTDEGPAKRRGSKPRLNSGGLPSVTSRYLKAGGVVGAQSASPAPSMSSGGSRGTLGPGSGRRPVLRAREPASGGQSSAGGSATNGDTPATFLGTVLGGGNAGGANSGGNGPGAKPGGSGFGTGSRSFRR